jgi:hypothetical protein
MTELNTEPEPKPSSRSAYISTHILLKIKIKLMNSSCILFMILQGFLQKISY